MATHPSTPERVAQAVVEARKFGAPGVGETGRDAYLSAIDGIAYGDNPAQGLVRGDALPSSQARLRLRRRRTASRWRTRSAALIGVGEGGAQALRLDSIALSAVDLARGASSPPAGSTASRPSSIETLPAAIYPMAIAVAQGEQWSFRLGAVRLGGRVFRLIFAAHSLTPAVDARFRAAIRSFHRLTAGGGGGGAARCACRIVEAQAGDTAASMAQRMSPEERARRPVPGSQRPRARGAAGRRPALQDRRPVNEALRPARLSGRIVAATHNKGKLAELDDLLGAARRRSRRRRRARPRRAGGDRRQLRRQRGAEGARRARAPPRCRRSPTIPACASRRSTTRRASIPPAGRAKGSDFAGAMARIERELKARGAPPPWRAHFVSALALAWPDGTLETFEGRVDGRLVFPPRGTSGFGYDPIFIPDGHERSFGEMTAQEKHGLPRDGSLALSHRARAFQKLARALID